KNAVIFFGGNGKHVSTLVGITANHHIPAVFFLGRKCIIQILESEVGRIKLVTKKIRFANQQVEIVDKAIPQVVQQYARSRFINNRIQILPVLCSCFQVVVVERKQAGIIVPE